MGSRGAGCGDVRGVSGEGEVPCWGGVIAWSEREAAVGGDGAERSVIGERGEGGRVAGDVGEVDAP